MNCQFAFSAAQIPQPNGGGPDFFRSCRNASEAVLDTALITKVMRALNSMPPLVLTPAMQRDAFQMDHDKALRGNRANAGRIAQEAKAATTALLRMGICSGEGGRR